MAKNNWDWDAIGDRLAAGESAGSISKAKGMPNRQKINSVFTPSRMASHKEMRRHQNFARMNDANNQAYSNSQPIKNLSRGLSQNLKDAASNTHNNWEWKSNNKSLIQDHHLTIQAGRKSSTEKLSRAEKQAIHREAIRGRDRQNPDAATVRERDISNKATKDRIMANKANMDNYFANNTSKVSNVRTRKQSTIDTGRSAISDVHSLTQAEKDDMARGRARSEYLISVGKKREANAVMSEGERSAYDAMKNPSNNFDPENKMHSFLNDLKEDFSTIKRKVFGGSGSNRAEEASLKRMDEVVSAMYGLNKPGRQPTAVEKAMDAAGIRSITGDQFGDKSVSGIHKLSNKKGLFGGKSELERYQQYVTNENEKGVRQYGDRVLGPRDKVHFNAEGHILPQDDFAFGKSMNGVHGDVDVKGLAAESRLQGYKAAKNRKLADKHAGFYENSDSFTGPSRPGETFRDKRANSKFTATPEQSEQYVKNEEEALKKKRAADKSLAAERDYFNKNVKGKGGASSTEGMTTKTFGVKMATGGFGLGFHDALHASRMEGLTRAASFANPLGASSREIMMNAFGVQNDVQRMQSRMATGFFQNLGAKASIAMPLGVALYGMSQYQDVSSIVTDQAVFGAAQAGWRVGTSLGIAATRAGGAGRIIGMGIGGVAMGALGGIGATLAIDAITDMTSNTSGVRAFAKKISGKEVYARGMDTRQSLTARQAALQKLSRSGLNDRAQLLGNEALSLRGVM